MSNSKTGGPAFPIPLAPGHAYTGHAPCDGMTLRDYFAAKAMQGQFTITSADRDFLNPDFKRDSDCPTTAERIARISYAMADAMLKARGQA